MRKSIFFFIWGLILVSTMIADTLNAQVKPDLEKLTYHKTLTAEFKNKDVYPVEH